MALASAATIGLSIPSIMTALEVDRESSSRGGGKALDFPPHDHQPVMLHCSHCSHCTIKLGLQANRLPCVPSIYSFLAREI